jgi:hypothetical protein
LIHPLVAEKRVAQIVLSRAFAAGVQEVGLITDHPHRLVKPELFHGLGKVMREHARLQFDQPGRELDLAGKAVLRLDGGREKPVQRFGPRSRGAAHEANE